MGSGSEICDHCFLESEGRHRLDWNGMFFLGGFVVGEMQLNCFMHYNLFHLSWSAWIWLGYVRVRLKIVALDLKYCLQHVHMFYHCVSINILYLLRVIPL